MTITPTDQFGVDIATGDLYANLPRHGWANVSSWTGDLLTTDELPATVEARSASDVVAKPETKQVEQ